MVTVAHTLGVAHSPGYPVYSLLGKIAQQVFPGNPSYRMNVLSALASALAGLGLFVLLCPGVGNGVALTAVGLWASSSLFWELSSVSEMYTLAFLGLVGLWGLGQRSDRRRWALAAFFYGVCFGVRTDFVLLSLPLAALFWQRGPWRKNPSALKDLAAYVGLFLLGLTVFLYLPFRSARQPWIDWNNPETFSRLMGSLLRRTHGGTLDMLSKSYGAGENFWSQFRLFFQNTAQAFTWAGIPLAVMGIIRWRKTGGAVFPLLVFVITGPLFIFMANLPPNPHAAAVLEAHFLTAQGMVLAALASGLAVLSSWLPKSVLGAACAGLVALNIFAHAGRGVKRWNLRNHDYAVNLLRGSAPESIGVLREDVPLFSLWEKTLVSRFRTDVAVAAQGLAASPWYHDMLYRQDARAALTPLREPADWQRFQQFNASRTIWAGGDVQLPFNPPDPGAGLAVYLQQAPSTPLFDFYIHRGEAPKDFFSSDLDAEYAQATLRRAAALLRQGEWEEADAFLQKARSFDADSPAVPFNRGFIRFKQGDFAGAERFYSEAAQKHEDLLRRARYYKSLPEVVQGLQKDASEVWVHRGVLSEKKGDLEQARRCYAQAVKWNPRNSQAHYNWAVTYWNLDWDQAAAHMDQAAALAPENGEFRRYLELARSFQKGKPGRSSIH